MKFLDEEEKEEGKKKKGRKEAVLISTAKKIFLLSVKVFQCVRRGGALQLL